jgi:hypothetical protein
MIEMMMRSTPAGRMLAGSSVLAWGVLGGAAFACDNAPKCERSLTITAPEMEWLADPGRDAGRVFTILAPEMEWVFDSAHGPGRAFTFASQDGEWAFSGGQTVGRTFTIDAPEVQWVADEDKAEVKGSAFLTLSTDEDDGEPIRIEVVIEDGEATVKLNGTKLEDARVERDDGKIVLLDQSGNVIKSIDVGGWINADENAWMNLFGTESDENIAELEIEEPSVMLGIHLDEPSEALCCHLRIEPGTATIVNALYKGLPAYEAGIEEFDVIVKVDGKTPADPKSLRAALAEKEPGDVVNLTVIHEGQPTLIAVTLEAYDREAMAEAELIGEAPVAPDPFAEFRYFGPGDVNLPKDAIQFYGKIPQLPDLLIDEGKRVIVKPPKIDIQVPELNYAHPMWQAKEPPAKKGDDLDQRLAELDKRLAQLEKILDRLIERAESNRK